MLWSYTIVIKYIIIILLIIILLPFNRPKNVHKEKYIIWFFQISLKIRKLQDAIYVTIVSYSKNISNM